MAREKNLLIINLLLIIKLLLLLTYYLFIVLLMIYLLKGLVDLFIIWGKGRIFVKISRYN